MTSSQLREILQSNILTIAAPDGANMAVLEDFLQAGAHILLAPPCQNMDESEAAVLDSLFEAAQDKAFVAGQLSGPTEKPEELGGSLHYRDYYNTVLNQAGWLIDMGVSMIFLNGFTDVITAKCAVYAVREADYDIPICVGLSVGDDNEAVKRALSLLIALQALDVCAVGCCGMDVEDTIHILSELQAFTTVPLFALSDPGHYLEPEDYRDYIPSFVNHKCAMLGLLKAGPAFAAAASKETWQFAPLRPDFPVLHAVCSQNETLFLDFSGKIVSQNKQLLEIKTEKQAELEQALSLFNQPGTAPVCFHILDVDLLEYAICHYAGRPAVRSDEYGDITAKELGAFVLSERDKTSK